MNPPKLTDPGRAHQGIEQPALMEALIQAAEQLLVEHGPEGVSAIRIASRAGVSLGTLMQCFRNKDAIIAEAMARRRRNQGQASTPSTSRAQPAAASRSASGSTPAARTPAAAPMPTPPPASSLFRKTVVASKPDPEPKPAAGRAAATGRSTQEAAPATGRAAATGRATQEPASARATATGRATQETASARSTATSRTQEPATASARAAATSRTPQEPAPARPVARARAAQEPAPAPARPAAPVVPEAAAETLEDGLLSVLRPFVSTIAAVLPSWPSLPQADRDAIFRVELKRLAAASEAMLTRQHVSDPAQVAYVMTHSCDKVVKDAIRHAPESFTDGRLEQALCRLCLDFVRST